MNMKKLLFKSTFFLFGFFLLGFALQLLITAAVRKIHIGDFGVLNAIENGTINAEILISGSSRGYFHYNPEILTELTGKSCFNISFNGSGLEIQVPALKWYLDRNKPPRFLIQNIDIFAGEIDPVVFMPYKFIPYLQNDNLYKGLLLLDGQWWLHKYVPCTNLIYFNKSFQKRLIREFYLSFRKKSDYLIRGYQPSMLHFSDKYEKEYLRQHASGLHYTITRAYRSYLEELIDLCQTRGIQLILVMSPEYEKIMPLEVTRQEVIDYYVRLSHEKGLPFFDFSQSEICRQRELFYNFTHMNWEGADQFSRELALLLKKTVLAE
jgi:hypothetical protein